MAEFDFEFTNFLFSDMIIEDLVSNNQLGADMAEKVHELLMKKHRHQFENNRNKRNSKYIKSLSEIGRSLSRGSNMGKINLPFFTIILYFFGKCLDACCICSDVFHYKVLWLHSLHQSYQAYMY